MDQPYTILPAFFALVRDRPDPGLSVLTARCPACDSDDLLRLVTHTRTPLPCDELDELTPDDPNHHWFRLRCTAWRELLLEQCRGNAWVVRYEYGCRVLMAGVPSCHEDYVYTCRPAAGRSTAAGGSPGQLPSPAGGARARLRAPRRTTGPSTSPAAARRGPRSGVVPAGSWSRWPSAMPRGTTSPRRGPPAASAGDRVPPPPDHVRTNEARRRTGGARIPAAPRHRSWGCDSRVAGKYCYFPAPSELDVR